MTAPADRLTTALAGRYRIERELGAGGMATVYLAEDLRHERKVAIKVLKPELAAVLGAERFVQEIKTTAALSHPHILPLFDSGEAGGFLYYVMPYIEGETIRDKLNRETQFGIDEAVKITAEVADALDYAHRHGVIHRDIKPENILLHDGRPMVMDFGIALAVSAAAGGRMTETGLSLGTPHYMSPEQATAKRDITGRSDIYSLGVVLYEMLTGELPHMGASAQQILLKIVTEDAAPVTRLRKGVPPNVAAALGKALEQLPADRFESARAFADALGNVHFTTAGASASSGTAGSNSRTFRGWVRSPWSWATIAAMLGAVALWVSARQRASSVTEPIFKLWTSEPQAIFNARFTPDGQAMAFDAMPAIGTTPRIFVVRPDHPDPVPLGPDSTHLLSVSPSGKLAVLTHARYVWHRLFEGTLATMAVRSGAPRELATGVREADWGPDDTSMALVRSNTDGDVLEYPVGTVLARSSGYLSDPRVSPSGDAVAYVEHPAGYDDRGNSVIVDRAGREVVRSRDYLGIEGIAWEPDGTRILFSAATADQPTRFLVHELSRSRRDRVVLSGASTLTILDVSRSGRMLLTEDRLSLAVFGRWPDATDDANLGVRDQSLGVVMSQNGRHLAFTDAGAFGGPNYTLLWRRTDGSSPVPLGEGAPLAFSADNSHVLALVPATPPRLMLYPTGPGRARRLDSGQFETLQWIGSIHMGDGDTTLFFCGAEPQHAGRCYLQALPGGAITPVTPPGVKRGWLSPDGTRVLAGIDTFTIYPIGGAPPRTALGFRPGDIPIRWSPDGREVWVRTNPGEVSPLRVDRVNPVTGARAALMRIVPRSLIGVRATSGPVLADDPRVYSYGTFSRDSRLYTVDVP